MDHLDHRSSHSTRPNGTRRVAVTGIGLITCAGCHPDAVWQSLLSGECRGIRRISRFEVDHLATQIAGTVDEFDPVQHFGRRASQDMDRVTQLSLYAADRAFSDSGLHQHTIDPYAFGVTFGTGFGGIDTTEREYEYAVRNPRAQLSPMVIPTAMHGATTFQIARRFGAKGANQTISTACSSSSAALGAAFRLIQHAEADVVIACGGDAPVVANVFRGWCALRAMSTRNTHPETAFSPFDVDRDGFVMGEGAGALVCERLDHAVERGAHVYGEVVGLGNTCDAYKLTIPVAAHQAEAMRRAIRDSGIEPRDVGFIIAHATATKLNDITESTAVQEVFGPAAEDIVVSACKPYFGHTIGACGALEFIVGLLALKHRRLHAIPNLSHVDPNCSLRFSTGEGVAVTGDAFMVSSFGFGGSNVVLIGRRPDTVPN